MTDTHGTIGEGLRALLCAIKTLYPKSCLAVAAVTILFISAMVFGPSPDGAFRRSLSYMHDENLLNGVKMNLERCHTTGLPLFGWEVSCQNIAFSPHLPAGECMNYYWNINAWGRPYGLDGRTHDGVSDRCNAS
jgi:hypothetical protein